MGIIAFTGREPEHVWGRDLSPGLDGYLVKSADSSELTDSIMSMVALRKRA